MKMNQKSKYFIFNVLMLGFLFLFSPAAHAEQEGGATPVLYYSTSCSHCQKVLSYLRGKNIQVIQRDIAVEKNKRELRNRGHFHVPVLVVGSRTYTGADQIITYLGSRDSSKY